MAKIRRSAACAAAAIAVPAVLFSAAILQSPFREDVNSTLILHAVAWSLAQWLPESALSARLQAMAWDGWGQRSAAYDHDLSGPIVLDIQTVSVQGRDGPEVLDYLERTYGERWRDRPVLLKGLWSEAELNDDRRRLSIRGLLREPLEIPYFTDARKPKLITPDSSAPVRQIMQRIASGEPSKIASQLIVKAYPDLIDEVAPTSLLTTLFGDHFSQRHLLGNYRLGFIPGTTTVPVFIANTNITSDETTKHKEMGEEVELGKSEKSCAAISTERASNVQMMRTRPVTSLHCEPIGNVAVQLGGSKQWTLIEPRYSTRLMPLVAPDGRAFFASRVPSFDHVPRYDVTTRAGDALWVPTWTWHRVEYASDDGNDGLGGGSGNGNVGVSSSTISIAGSLFHFRVVDFVLRNPLFAMLIVPAMVKELLGIKTQ